MEKKYYGSIEELEKHEPVQKNEERPEGLLGLLENGTSMFNSSRRDFLKLFGYSIASAAVLSSCEQPVRKAIPYLIKPDEITPGIANYYASTYYDGNDYCSILVKVRDGRPIKIEGNTLSSITKGGTSARIQASLLSLYDTSRYQFPVKNKQKSDWEEIDREITEKLKRLNAENKTVYLVTSTIISPSTLAVIETFKKSYPNIKHIQYDAISYSGLLLANEQLFEKRIIPSYHFDKADLIVSFGADFLGSWLSPVEFTKQYVKNRKLDEGQKKLSRHIHLEGSMSLTGSNADRRIIIKPSQEKVILAELYSAVLKNITGEVIKFKSGPVNISEILSGLLKNRGKSLVVSGSNDEECQVLVNGINYLLGNYGTTIDLNIPVYLHQGIDGEMFDLTEVMEKGDAGGVLFYNVNPVYDFSDQERFTKALKKCELTVSLSDLKNETAEASQYVCPDHYYLESWNDAEPKKGFYSLSQPAINPIFNTRSAQESILKWSGSDISYYNFLKLYWESAIYPLSHRYNSFYEFWTRCVQDGVFETETETGRELSLDHDKIKSVAGRVETSDPNSYEIQIYENISAGSGRLANNPWLQEVPDPVSKVCWDNYAAVSPKLAKELSVKTGDIIILNGRLTLPVLVQPGQEYKTISVALGYGRVSSGLVADGVGVNIYPLVEIKNKTRIYNRTVAEVKRKEGNYELAMTQTHHSMEGRPIVRETTLPEFLKNPASGNELHEEVEQKLVSLYKQRKFEGHHWGMAIDLNSCTGCSACVVACMSENNVPVVGKKQVVRAHEMHWIRIDRYYSGDVENPEVVRQPVMCQHCNNAPCENVCPVSATTHSNEGLNQMIYNRCIGTRYCNNNCPYKVRRFNFFDYNKADSIPFNTKDATGMTLDLSRMVLNPDVVVRAKGVMEKCTFCVQRIQEKKLTAKLEERTLRDGELVTACAQACPADAIVFGDLSDPESKISRMFNDKRNYHLLEEIQTLPNVGYLTRVRNNEMEI